MQSVKVGQALTIRGQVYMCIRITKREETYVASVDSVTVKQNHKLNPSLRGGSSFCMKFECDDFEVDETITERLEEIRFQGLEVANPLTVINYHTYTKEIEADGESGTKTTSSGEAEEAQPQAGEPGPSGGSGLRAEGADQDSGAGDGAGPLREGGTCSTEQEGEHATA
jgi:hypothetical protein